MPAKGEANVPKGWKRVRLGDVARERNQRAHSAERIFSVTKHAGFVPSLEYFNRQVFSRNTSNYKVVHHGDLAYATIHLDEGSLGILLEAEIGAISPMYTVFEADVEQVEPKFLFATLKLPQMVSKYKRLGEGTVHRRKSISFERLSALSFAIPDVQEQRRVIAVLDSIDDAIEGAEAVIAATGQLRDSLLHDLLTRGLPGQHTEWRDVPSLGTIPADWEVVRLGDVIPKFEYGTSVKCSSEPVGMPILRIPNIALGRLNLSDLKYADLGPKESASVQLDAGDVLLVRTNGNPDICGQCWVSDGLEGRWGFASYLVRGRADRSVVNPWFVGHFLRSEVGRGLLRGNIRTSAGNYNLSVRDIGSIPLPCPTLTEQEAVVNTVEGLARIVEVAEDELQGLRLLRGSTADALLTGRVRNKQYGGFE